MTDSSFVLGVAPIVTNWILIIAALGFVGNPSDRSILHFSSTNCPACGQIQPVIDQLNREGWSIRSIDSARDTATADRWRVQQIPTVIVLDKGREVDRIVGSLKHTELRRRLTGDVSSPPAAKPASPIASGNTASLPANSMYGPNHPMHPANRSSNLGPNHPLYRSNLTSQHEVSESIGVNHPYYSQYKKPRIAVSSAQRTQPQPKRAPRRPLPDAGLPDSPGTMAATVRIRVKHNQSESVGTGTIIQTKDRESTVLTCGHLFRHKEDKSSISVELFEDGEIVPIPATLVDFRNDEVDLGLVAFRRSNPVSSVSILPKREQIQEDQFVFSIGCDGGDAPSRRDTYITKLNRFLGPSNVEIAGAPVQGRSGGGLFDIQGRLIGVCIAADNDLDEGMFVGPEAIYGLLAKNKLNQLFE